MHPHRTRLALAALLLATATAYAADPTKPLVDFSKDGVEKLFTPTSSQVTAARSADPVGLNVTITPGKEGYPGLKLTPEKPFNLADFGHVEAKITNTGAKSVNVALRLDGAGDWRDNPYNTESVTLKPGASGTVSTIFGYSYGKKPGYKLDPSAVVNVLIFTGKSDADQTFRIEFLQAAGPKGEAPPVDPKSIRIEPPKGVILGNGSALEQSQIDAANGAKAALTTDGAQTLKIEIPANAKNPVVTLKPKAGRWSLRFYTDLRVTVKNTGTTPVTPKFQAVSDGNGNTDYVSGPELAPGKSAEVTIPFAASIPWTGVPGAGTQPQNWNPPRTSGTYFASDATAAIKISAAGNAAASFTVESIRANVTTAQLPDWLGKRPPVEGDWVQTMAEEFDKEPNPELWNIYGPNYWDKKTHWSKDNITIKDGLLRFRFEKKDGHHNDDPKEKKTPYACGFLDNYGKWAQRYGYFEARVKLPVAEGIWPTFWMMPDRGPAFGPQWKRADTGKGAMELDIMEHLSRWGPYRYNIAHHWDGYQKEHKQNGTSYVYYNPDKDGFMTVGILWLPGQTRFYNNGTLVGRWDDARISNVRSHMIFETTTGGWDNNAVVDSQLPVDYVVDYVRVWQRKDLASEADGKTPPAPATAPATAPAK